MKVLPTDQLNEMKPPEWLLEDFYAENSTTLVYGPSGLGKSFMVLDQVLTMSTGADWYGRAVARPLKTLYIVAEGASWWYRRIQAFQQERMGINKDNLLWVPEPVDLWTPGTQNEPGPGIRALEEVLEEHEPDLMVFDTWVRVTSAFGMNEDKASDTSRVIRQLDRLRDEYAVTPVIVHHPTKTGNFRGSGNQGASVERIIALEAGENDSQFKVHDEKGNHMEPFTDFIMHFESVQIDDDITSAVIRFDGELAIGRGSNLEMMVNAVRPWKGKVLSFGKMETISGVEKGSMTRTVEQGLSQNQWIKTEDGYEIL